MELSELPKELFALAMELPELPGGGTGFYLLALNSSNVPISSTFLRFLLGEDALALALRSLMVLPDFSVEPTTR